MPNPTDEPRADRSRPRCLGLTISAAHIGKVAPFVPMPNPVMIRPTSICAAENEAVWMAAPMSMVPKPR